MASQAAIFAETIAGMKKAIKRKAYDSDSDSSIEYLTNRGHKLKKKARYVHEGQLAPPSGPLVYKRRINHAGFDREIISRNPPLIDEDGYEVDSEDDDERAHAAIVAAAEFDPYADVKIEHLLAPLTAASDLPDHPTLSKPFKSKTLTELTRQACEIVQKEKASLWRIKHLLTRLSGDNTWMPCESVEEDDDINLFFDDEREKIRGNQPAKPTSKEALDHLSTGTLPSDSVAQNPTIEAVYAGEATLNAAKETADEPTIGNELAIVTAAENGIDGEDAPMSDAKPDAMHESASTKNIPDANHKAPTEESMDVAKSIDSVQLAAVDGNIDKEVQDDTEEAVEDQDDVPAPTRMRTRAQAQAQSDNTATSRTRSATPDSSIEYVHPYFLAPLKSHPDRDLGLPPHEAEETRRLLQLYIQKQEEVCRGAERVYNGLLRANRYRHLVMKWAKAEAHVGVNRDMSDGEDWYDKEEWGLTEDLKKGQDEEEEDAATTAKKTRTRRQ